MWWGTTGYKTNFFKIEGFTYLERGTQMSEMDGIECTAEDTNHAFSHEVTASCFDNKTKYKKESISNMTFT